MIRREGEARASLPFVDPDEPPPVDERHVQESIMIEVAQGEGEIGAVQDFVAGIKRSAPCIEQDRDVTVSVGGEVATVLDREIEGAVTADVSKDDAQWSPAYVCADLVTECSVSMPGQDGDVVRASVRDDDVDEAVPIHVAEGDGGRIVTDRQTTLWRERSIAVAEKQREVVRAGVGHHQVQPPVSIQVGDRQGRRGQACAHSDLLEKHAVIRAEKNRDVVGELIGRYEVHSAVAV